MHANLTQAAERTFPAETKTGCSRATALHQRRALRAKLSERLSYCFLIMTSSSVRRARGKGSQCQQLRSCFHLEQKSRKVPL